MSKRILGNKGFTLIEIIASLVLLSIITAVVGLGIYKIFEGFISVKKNAAAAQKAQVAMVRLVNEFTGIAVISGNATSLNYKSYSYLDGTLKSHTVTWEGTSGSPLLLDGVTLIDNVSSFNVVYLDAYNSAVEKSSWSSSTKIIEVTLVNTGAYNTTSSFTFRAVPRNL
jgi:prepilin-type N-terminal cleavage/methylation domain-containing protein